MSAVEPLEGRILMAARVYEAEAALVSGATVSHAHGGFDGPGFVDYRNASGDFVEWTVNIDADGTFSLTFRYANGASTDRPLALSVDGVATASAQSFPVTGFWTTWNTTSHALSLSAGTHAVRLTAVGASGPNVDSLEVRPVDGSPPPPPPPATQTLQAEAATFAGGYASRAKSGYLGDGYVDFRDASGDYVEWSVDAASAGTVELQFRYANGSTTDRPLELSVNGRVVAPALSFAPTGSWTRWGTAVATVALDAGTNTVRLTAVGAGGPNVDALVLPAAPVPTPGEEIRSLRVYHIGNSLTNGINYASLDKMAEADGREYVFARHVISGAPLSWIWDHPDGGNRQAPFGRSQESLPKDPWDVLTLEPFDRQLYQPDGSGDVQVAQKFINLALTQSPDLQTYIYQRWPRRKLNADGTFAPYDYEKLWLRSYTGKWDATQETREYFTRVVQELRKAYPKSAKPVLMVPVGDVLFELNRRIVAGEVPAIDSIDKLFADGIHLTNWGALVVGTTFYATMYKRDPRGLDFHAYDVVDDPLDSKIPAGFAKVVQDVVWEVVKSNPLTGV